jgi:hypothetical protein
VAASASDAVLDFAYAAPYRLRSAYRFTAEDSVYVGRTLLGALVARCSDARYRQIVAVIGDNGNAASIVLHERLGFRRVGFLPAIGFKHGRWVDGVLMQRELSGRAAKPALRQFVAGQAAMRRVVPLAPGGKKMGRAMTRPKFREETPRRRTAGRRATTDAALHNMTSAKA